MYRNELQHQLSISKSFALPLWLKRSRPDILNWIISETNIYSIKNIMEGVHIVLNGPPPLCSCGNPRKFNTFENGYRIGCNLGNKCIDVTKNRTEKQKITLLEKYGVTNSAQLDFVQEKIRNTNLQKYGTTHHSRNETVKQKTLSTRKSRPGHAKRQQLEKTKQNNLLKYGVTHHMKLTSQQEKVKNTNLERYNCEFPMQNEKSAKKMRETYVKNNDINRVNNKRKQTMLKKYGVDSAARISLSSDTLKVLTDKDTFVNFVTDKTREQVLQELNIHDHTLYLYAQKYDATHLFVRPLISNFEKEVAQYLDDIGVSYSQNDRTVIAPRELDFYISEHKLAIECCGLYWHSENSAGRGRNYHYEKYKSCCESDITLLTIFQDEWENNKEKVKARIRINIDTQLERIYARNTVVCELDTVTSKTYINANHLQSYAQSSVKLGLYHGDELVSIMTFGKCRYNKNFEWELIRYCSTKSVIGGASKLWEYFRKKYNPTGVVSYSDNRYFSGNMYKALNFTEKKTHIGYFYTDYKTKFNRLQFQKHKLVEQGHDINKSEWQIMQECGYDRIWDCGQTTWTYQSDK